MLEVDGQMIFTETEVIDISFQNLVAGHIAGAMMSDESLLKLHQLYGMDGVEEIRGVILGWVNIYIDELRTAGTPTYYFYYGLSDHSSGADGTAEELFTGGEEWPSIVKDIEELLSGENSLGNLVSIYMSWAKGQESNNV